jgi:hypothetical protein
MCPCLIILDLLFGGNGGGGAQFNYQGGPGGNMDMRANGQGVLPGLYFI